MKLAVVFLVCIVIIVFLVLKDVIKKHPKNNSHSKILIRFNVLKNLFSAEISYEEDIESDNLNHHNT